MNTPTLSGFIIALVVISFFACAFGLFYSNLSSNYNVEYNNDTEVFNKMDKLSDSVSGYKKNITEAEIPTNEYQDLSGGIFNSGIRAANTIANSYDLFIEMLSSSVMEKLGFGQASGFIRTFVFTLVLVILVIAILLGIILKSERS